MTFTTTLLKNFWCWIVIYFTYETKKIPLLYFDDKRFVLDDGIQTLAYFTKKLQK